MYSENSILNRSNNKFFTLSDIYKIFDECGYINPYVFHYRFLISFSDRTVPGIAWSPPWCRWHPGRFVGN